MTPPTPPTSRTALTGVPTVSPIRAQLIAPSTIYGGEAGDPDGDRLTFTWSRDRNACGKFEHGGTFPILNEDQARAAKFTIPNAIHELAIAASLAMWTHLQELCPHDESTSHKGTVRVVVSDGVHSVTRTYDGTETGIGKLQ